MHGADLSHLKDRSLTISVVFFEFPHSSLRQKRQLQSWAAVGATTGQLQYSTDSTVVVTVLYSGLYSSAVTPRLSIVQLFVAPSTRRISLANIFLTTGLRQGIHTE